MLLLSCQCKEILVMNMMKTYLKPLWVLYFTLHIETVNCNCSLLAHPWKEHPQSNLALRTPHIINILIYWLYPYILIFGMFYWIYIKSKIHNIIHHFKLYDSNGNRKRPHWAYVSPPSKINQSFIIVQHSASLHPLLFVHPKKFSVHIY